MNNETLKKAETLKAKISYFKKIKNHITEVIQNKSKIYGIEIRYLDKNKDGDNIYLSEKLFNFDKNFEKEKIKCNKILEELSEIILQEKIFPIIENLLNNLEDEYKKL